MMIVLLIIEYLGLLIENYCNNTTGSITGTTQKMNIPLLSYDGMKMEVIDEGTHVDWSRNAKSPTLVTSVVKHTLDRVLSPNDVCMNGEQR